MHTPSAARLLELHFDETDRYQGRPLYEAIVDRARQLHIAGATVFRGLEGFGDTAEVHRHRIGRRDQPIVVTIVDTAENLARLIPELEAMLDTGLIATTEVEAIRIENTEPRM